MATILIVDDVKTDRELLGRVVAAAGHDPVYASDGEEGIAKARELKPALILMDVVMPVLNGFNACRRLKSDEQTARIPIVLVTTKGGESDRFWGQRQGAEDHLVKPFTAETLTATIRRFAR